MRKINAVFIGTHNFAVKILEGLIDSPEINISLVITQPDKPVGRKKEIQSPPIKILAEKHNIKVEQPKVIKNYNLPTEFDIAILAQYGQMIPTSILQSPKHGVVNVHTSLLPKYRGASPIQSAILNGEKETGITIMVMDEGMDTGDILVQSKVSIDENDMFSDIENKLATEAINILPNTLLKYIGGELTRIPQNDSESKVCKRFVREDGKVDWNKNALEIYNQYRALTPWPGVWTSWNDKRIKLLKIKPGKRTISPGAVSVKHGTIEIGCANGSILVEKLQLEGKTKMDAETFANGIKNFDGAVLV